MPSPLSPDDLEPLRAHATPRQAEYLDAIAEHGSVGKAARALGIDRRLIFGALARLRDSFGSVPGADGVHPDAPDFRVRELSSLYGTDGKTRINWVKAVRDDDAIRRREAAEAFAARLPRARPVQAVPATDADLATCYVLTDYHLGMLAWHEEAGEDWDLQIAEDLLVRWFAHAIDATPPAELGIFAQLGDFLHWDGLEALTPASKHVLDADTRFQKLVRVAIRSVRRIIAMLLAKHARLVVIMADANHDPASSVWLREGLAAHYDSEPRVTVDVRGDGYYCVEHGATSLFFHHGHRRKVEAVDRVFAAKFREIWGRTRQSYAHMGHYHEPKMVSSPIMVVEQHPTLAAADAYASRSGYVSKRSASAITYHREYGDVGRVVIPPERVMRRAA